MIKDFYVTRLPPGLPPGTSVFVIDGDGNPKFGVVGYYLDEQCVVIPDTSGVPVVAYPYEMGYVVRSHSLDAYNAFYAEATRRDQVMFSNETREYRVVNQAMEEAAELAVVLSHYSRKRVPIANVVNEGIDVVLQVLKILRRNEVSLSMFLQMMRARIEAWILRGPRKDEA